MTDVLQQNINKYSLVKEIFDLIVKTFKENNKELPTYVPRYILYNKENIDASEVRYILAVSLIDSVYPHLWILENKK